VLREGFCLTYVPTKIQREGQREMNGPRLERQTNDGAFKFVDAKMQWMVRGKGGGGLWFVRVQKGRRRKGKKEEEWVEGDSVSGVE
jgi:hypothetical protein